MILLYLSAVLNSPTEPAYAASESLISELHRNPPSPCIAKSTDDDSSMIAITPEGNTREEVRGHMGAIGSIFLASGAHYMTPANIAAVYTAVFFQDDPINEVGVYAYLFKQDIDAEMFKAKTELHGRYFILGRRLLVLLWHEKIEQTGRCYAALEHYFAQRL